MVRISGRKGRDGHPKTPYRASAAPQTVFRQKSPPFFPVQREGRPGHLVPFPSAAFPPAFPFGFRADGLFPGRRLSTCKAAFPARRRRRPASGQIHSIMLLLSPVWGLPVSPEKDPADPANRMNRSDQSNRLALRFPLQGWLQSTHMHRPYRCVHGSCFRFDYVSFGDAPLAIGMSGRIRLCSTLASMPVIVFVNSTLRCSCARNSITGIVLSAYNRRPCRCASLEPVSVSVISLVTLPLATEV